MDKQRMAKRTIIEEEQNMEFTVQVSGKDVELHRTYEQPWDNEHGTGPDIAHEVWTMSLDTLKRFMTAAQWCIEKSAAFEASHPLTSEYVQPDDCYEEIAKEIEEMSQSEPPEEL